ncbi:MAG TPA: response regulator, partial [Gemmatimonadales bacterium]|nr:response regulator [Gemmatimonadales bacterium]
PVNGAFAAPPVQPAHILVVDDQEDNRSVLERRLRRQGHTVESATGGRSALELLGAQQFDLVLLDVLMPDLDGLAVLERMKADAATRDIPVIMISALDDVASVVRCIERGAEDHLPKPFDPVLLRARISACLEKKRLRDIELEYLREVGRVIQAAIQVEAGSYENGTLAQVAQRGDELGRLARVFDAMANQVRAREDRLKEQVAALRREIGEARQTSKPAAPRGALSLPTGKLFAGRFEVLDEIGSGGMGMVYRALDRELGDQVAIKTLRPELLQDTSLVERFKSEIRLARTISSKHVVRTHDIGERDGVYYLTMEYVEGITVRELLDTRGRLGTAPTLAIASQLAQSLVAAHEQGVIHRDIKPQNLL